MLNKEDNELLTRVENGAPMGALMRQYWLPLFRSQDLVADGAPRRAQLLGERLVAFRDSNGAVGVLDEFCPHRGASLALARNDNCALQCIYHGWRIDTAGRIVDTPSEPDDSTFKDHIRHVAFPVREAGGLIWTYIGDPGKEPRFPDFDWTRKRPEQVFTLRVLERCNWAQALEGVLDSAHIGFLHRDLVGRLAVDNEAYTGGGGLLSEIVVDGHPKLEIQNTPYGFWYAAVRKATHHGDQVTFVRSSHFVAPMWGLFPAPEGWYFQQAFVPIDDYHTMFYFVHHRSGDAVITDAERLQIAEWAGVENLDEEGGIAGRTFGTWWKQDRAAMMDGTSFTGLYGKAQLEDFAVQESMGPLFDRSREHLGSSDLACIRMRRIMLDAARNTGSEKIPPALNADFAYDEIRAEERLIDVGTPASTVGFAQKSSKP